MESSRKMRPAMKFTIAFVIIAIVLTFFSKTIYNAKIPEVKVVGFTTGNLTKVFQTNAVVSPSETIGIYPKGTMRVTSVEVEPGDTVAVGDVIAHLDVTALETELTKAEIELQKQELELKDVWGDRRKIAQAEIDLQKSTIESLEALIAESRDIVSPVDGRIVEVSIEMDMTVSQMDCIFRIAESGAGYTATALMDPNTAALFSIGDDVIVTGRGGWVNTQGKIDQFTLSPDGNVNVRVLIERDMKYGDVVLLDFRRTTDKYPFVLPKSTLTEDNCIYILKEKEGVLGTEYSIKKVAVTVEDSDSESIAVSGDFIFDDKVVISSDKELRNGRVKLYHDDL